MILVPSGIHASKWFHGRAIEWVSMILFHMQDLGSFKERKELEMRLNQWTSMTS